jgi:hypothetical protein
MSPLLPYTCAKVIIARWAAAMHFRSERRTKPFDQFVHCRYDEWMTPHALHSGGFSALKAWKPEP